MFSAYSSNGRTIKKRKSDNRVNSKLIRGQTKLTKYFSMARAGDSQVTNASFSPTCRRHTKAKRMARLVKMTDKEDTR